MGLLKAFFRAIVAILVVVAGLLAALAMGVVAVVFLLMGTRARRRGASEGKQGRAIPGTVGDVIDVTATEVVEPEKTA